MAMCADDQKESSSPVLLCSSPSQKTANSVRTERAIVTASSHGSVRGLVPLSIRWVLACNRP